MSVFSKAISADIHLKESANKIMEGDSCLS